MLRVNRLREFVVEVKTAIPTIKYTQVIITNDEFVKFLEERKTSDNIMLFAVIPEHGVMGQEDRTKYENYLQFFFIEKQAEKNSKHDEKLDLYNRVQETVKSFVDTILEAKSGDSDVFESCNMLDELNEESIEIKTFWDGVQCRGYEVLFDLNTKI
jgi:hypothetical protein